MTVEDSVQLDQALREADEEARKRGMLGAVQLKAANGNVITMVVGGYETVLGFDYGHLDLRYYASRGLSDSEEPLLTCYLMFQHHTEFPRKYVIPTADGVNAVRQFLDSGELPTCVKWDEV